MFQVVNERYLQRGTHAVHTNKRRRVGAGLHTPIPRRSSTASQRDGCRAGAGVVRTRHLKRAGSDRSPLAKGQNIRNQGQIPGTTAVDHEELVRTSIFCEEDARTGKPRRDSHKTRGVRWGQK